MIDVDPKFYFVCHFCISLLRYQGRTKGEGWSTANLLKPTSNFIVCRSKAALLFWFFGDFRCGVSLFFVILVIYKYQNR